MHTFHRPNRLFAVVLTMLACLPFVAGCPNGGAEGPTAEFTATPLTGAGPLKVEFLDRSSPGKSAITSWSWDFGDGSTSSAANPAHTYYQSGVYSVSLTVTTRGGAHTTAVSDLITVYAKPSAEFSATPLTGPGPLEVAFTDQSAPGDEPILQWLWDFGDGSTSTDRNPVHTYQEAGDYTVSLTAGNDLGSTTKTKPGYVTVRNAPTAQFAASPLEGPFPLEVTFTDQSMQGSAPITFWRWDFGDGSTSTDARPVHVYRTPGRYNVSLTVTSTAGSDTLVRRNLVNVQAPPVAQPVAVPKVTGMIRSAAEVTLNMAGLAIGFVREDYHQTMPAGRVISQDPEAGAIALPGAEVSLLVSKGMAPVPVPDVLGLLQSDAEEAIRNSGLTLGDISGLASDIVPLDRVISQNPPANTLVMPGSAIALSVSVGSAEMAIHMEAWSDAASKAGYDKYHKYAIYASRSLMVSNPEVYLQADAVWMEQIATVYGGWLAEYRHRDRVNDDTYWDDVGSAINTAFLLSITRDGTQFQWSEFEWGRHRENAARAEELYDTRAPFLPWADMRLPLLWNAMKGTEWRTPVLTLAQALYFKMRDEGKAVYLLISDAERGYVAEIVDSGVILHDPLTGQAISRSEVVGRIVLAMNQNHVWYPLMERDDTFLDGDLAMVVLTYASANAEPDLAIFERSILASLRASTPISSDLDERWAVFFASRFLNQMSWRSTPLRELMKPLFYDRYLECAGRYSDSPYEIAALQVVITEMANRLSPAAAVLAVRARNTPAPLATAMSSVGEKYRAWFQRADSTWVYGEYYRAWMPSLDDKVLSKVGNCVVEACNVGAALVLADVPGWDVWIPNWWSLDGSGGHVIAGVYTANGAGTLDNGVYRPGAGAAGPLYTHNNQWAFAMFYRPGSGFLVSGQLQNPVPYSLFEVPFTNMDHGSTTRFLRDIAALEPELRVATGNTVDLAHSGIEEYSQFVDGLSGSWRTFDFRPITSQDVIVPNLHAMEQASAEFSLIDMDLMPGTVVYAHSGSIPQGAVISQDPPAGSVVRPGTAIHLVVSHAAKQLDETQVESGVEAIPNPVYPFGDSRDCRDTELANPLQR